MRILATISVAALMTLGLAAQASAFSLNPKSTTISATGSTSLTKGGVTIACTTTLGGNIDAAGVGHISSATFAPGSSLCTSIHATGLPWTVTATTLTALSVSGVAVSTPLGACGPSTISATLSSGVATFTGQVLSGACTINGSLTTSPTVTITNP